MEVRCSESLNLNPWRALACLRARGGRGLVRGAVGGARRRPRAAASERVAVASGSSGGAGESSGERARGARPDRGRAPARGIKHEAKYFRTVPSPIRTSNKMRGGERESVYVCAQRPVRPCAETTQPHTPTRERNGRGIATTF